MSYSYYMASLQIKNFDDGLLHQLKVCAAQDKATLTEFVTLILEKGVREFIAERDVGTFTVTLDRKPGFMARGKK